MTDFGSPAAPRAGQIELRTLGAVDLKGAGGVELRSVLQQPKRLGLLVYLTLANPGKLQRRDSLLGLFWPDLDQDHARAALRRALYFLRQACGEELLVGRGDEEIGSDPARIWCDALAFIEHVRGGALEAGLALYGGHLLDGFYVAAAPEVETWLDRERARLRELAAGAAWRLAAEHRDPATAIQWARKGLALAPTGEEALRLFLTDLDRRGDRVGAIRLYEDFASRLRTDFAVEPSAATVELVRELRRRATPDRAAVEPSARDRPVVVVTPFAVRGDAAHAYLREGMVDLFSTKLDGTGRIRTVDARLVLQHPAGQNEFDPAAGQRLARALGAGFFVIGTLLESGGRIEAGVALYDVDRNLLSRVEGRADREADLFELVDDLVRRLVADWSSSSAERLSRLAALTTTSLPALKSYLLGEREFRAGRHYQALDAFRRASTEDGSFALAYYRLASSLAANALIGPARLASTEAHRHRERLSDHDRMLLEAQHAWLHGATGDAERRYAALTIQYPEQVEPWYLLGDLLFHHNPYRGRSISEARAPFERALGHDPEHIGAMVQLARLAALEGRQADLAELAEKALRLSPGGDQALGLRTLRAYALGYTGEQKEVTAELVRGPGLTIARAFADVALYTDDFDGAERLARALLPAARSEEFQALGQLMLAHLAMARGRRQDAFDYVRLAARLEPAWAIEVKALFYALPFVRYGNDEYDAIEREVRDWDPAASRASVAMPLVFHDGLHAHLRGFLLGLLRARRGDALGVAVEAEALAELPVPSGADVLVEHLIRTLEADALRLQGRGPDALAVLERLKTGVWFQFAVASPFYAGTYHRFLRADLLAEAGRTDEALAWWRSIAQRSPYELVFLAASEQRMAAVLHRTGRPQIARRHQARAAALIRNP